MTANDISQLLAGARQPNTGGLLGVYWLSAVKLYAAEALLSVDIVQQHANPSMAREL